MHGMEATCISPMSEPPPGLCTAASLLRFLLTQHLLAILKMRANYFLLFMLVLTFLHFFLIIK